MIIRPRAELIGKIENVANGGGPKGIDRLRVVANHGEATALRLQSQQDRGLQTVRVLIFVDEDMIEAAADIVGECRRRDIICAQ